MSILFLHQKQQTQLNSELELQIPLFPIQKLQIQILPVQILQV